MSVEDVRRGALRVLTEEYLLHARDSYLKLEVFRRRKSRKAVYELRDFLDDLAHTFVIEDEGEALARLEEARTHLRRAYVEPMEYQAERQFVWLDRYVTVMMWVPLAWHVKKTSVMRQMIEAKTLVYDGRRMKATNGAEAHKAFERSFHITTDLLAELAPMRGFIKGAATALA